MIGSLSGGSSPGSSSGSGAVLSSCTTAAWATKALQLSLVSRVSNRSKLVIESPLHIVAFSPLQVMEVNRVHADQRGETRGPRASPVVSLSISRPCNQHL